MSDAPRWSALLTRPIPLQDGRFVRTLADARALTAKNKRGGERDPWGRAEPLLKAAAESGTVDDIDRATGQLELVVFGAGQMQL